MAAGLTPLALASARMFSSGGSVEIDDAFGIAGTDRDLVHIDVGRMRSVPPSAIAIVAIAPGMFLAHSVVPSSGSTAMSTLKSALVPTFSPMKSIGASSSSPSPITTVPSIGNVSSSRRMASTAAWSAAFSSPRPRNRAAIDRRALGHAHDLQRQNALEHQTVRNGNRRHHYCNLLAVRAVQSAAQFFSIRITCGRPEITRSRRTAASALWTASSLVA